MSKGRKSVKHSTKVKGVNKESLIGNLTLSDGNVNALEITRRTNKASAGPSSSRGDKRRAGEKVGRMNREFYQDHFRDIDQEQVDNLNIRFQQRANEVVRRNAFRGRDQLILTDRIS